MAARGNKGPAAAPDRGHGPRHEHNGGQRMTATYWGAGLVPATIGRSFFAALLLLGLAATPAAAGEAQSTSRVTDSLVSPTGQTPTGFAAVTGDRTFTRVAGLPAADMTVAVAPDSADAASIRRVEQLVDEDAVAAVMVDGAQERALTDLLISDSTGSVDLAAIERVRVGKPTDEATCLTEALYHEARGETIPGLVAVAEVILNRVDSRYYPDTVCEVVGQGIEYAPLCQFSYKCDGLSDKMTAGEARSLMEKIAWVMLSGKPRILTGKATHYHTNAVNPGWAAQLVRTARIGDHIFYRRGMVLSSR